MRIQLLPAALLLLAPVAAFAADPMTPTPLPSGAASASSASSSPAVPAVTPGNLNSEINALKAVFQNTSQCFDDENALKSDLNRKKASLNAEFKGKIPVAFNDLLWQKTSRLNKQHAACVAQYDELGRRFTAIHQTFRTIEPKNQNVKRQKDEVDALKARFLQMQPTAKAYNKAPAKKAADAPEAAE